MINVFGGSTGDEEIAELSTSIRAGWMGMGEKVRQFEKAFEERLGTGFLMLDSGSNALFASVKLLDLPPGSEVIVPSLTWVACAQAILLCGHRPIFADVNAETLSIDAAAIERCITKKTRAIIVVHYAGKPVRVETLKSFGLPIIEDAAHAVDSKLKGRYCGTLGDLGIFSFDSVKNLATPEAGGIASASAELIDRARRLRYCGVAKSGLSNLCDKPRWWEYDIVDIFPKFLPNDISASIGLVQLRKLEKHQRRRRQIWEIYQRELAQISWLKTPAEPAADEQHSYFTYFIRVLDGRRDALARSLLQAGIYTTLRYHPLHLNSIYGASTRLPVCELLNEQGLNLPLHPGLSDSDVDQVIAALKNF